MPATPPEHPPSENEAPPAPNRAARRARGGRRPDQEPGTGKVRPVGLSHAPDPRRFVKARRG